MGDEVIGGGGWVIFQKVYIEQIEIMGGNWHFRWGDFFRWDLKTPSIKNREYESKNKKMIPIVISTISQFPSPTRTTCW